MLCGSGTSTLVTHSRASHHSFMCLICLQIIMSRSRPIKLSEIDSYINSLEASGEFELEFESLGDPTMQLKSMEVANFPENLTKHRYPLDNLGAYDETRVVLAEVPGESNSDYINANWVNGYRGERRYIVTQAPLTNTQIDFYRMIWENNVHQIVMLASENDIVKGKCIPYYPDDSTTFGEIEVTLQEITQISEHIVERIYSVRRGEIKRVLVHYHFVSWPDLSVPKDPSQILSLHHKYRKDDDFSTEWPLLIHCSAGVGRTGTFVLSDIMYDMAKNEDHVDFLECLCLLRDQRISMIEKPEQYFFAHKVILLAYKEGYFNKEKVA